MGAQQVIQIMSDAILAHKRALKAAQMRRYRAKLKKNGG